MNYIIDMCGGLEWIADCKVKCCVTVPVGMDDWPLFLSHRRIVGFQTEIESEQEIGEVKSQAKSVGDSYLFPEGVEFKHASGLIFVVVDCPYVSSVDKCSGFKDPEQFCPVLKAHVQTDVAALVDKIAYGVVGVISARAEVRTPQPRTPFAPPA